jgi:hypothetical protein
MRNAHHALNACHKGRTIDQKPTSSNSKTVERTRTGARGYPKLLFQSDLCDSFGGLASRAIPA